MQIVPREVKKSVRRERTTGRIRGTKGKEENKRLRCEKKGADSSEGLENKMHDGREIKCEAGK